MLFKCSECLGAYIGKIDYGVKHDSSKVTGIKKWETCQNGPTISNSLILEKGVLNKTKIQKAALV